MWEGAGASNAQGAQKAQGQIAEESDRNRDIGPACSDEQQLERTARQANVLQTRGGTHGDRVGLELRARICGMARQSILTLVDCGRCD